MLNLREGSLTALEAQPTSRLEVVTLLKMQWAAVTTHLELTSVPPQKKRELLWDLSLSSAIQGYSFTFTQLF